jgi:hypothetical protein
MKLHEVDAPNGPAESGLSHVETEELRRTFWMAYSLDRVINLINQMPLTLNEQVVSQHGSSIMKRLLMTRATDTHPLAEFRGLIPARPTYQDSLPFRSPHGG